ncbi:ADAMTS-like protein 1 [Varanus komodoensis]|nr:ADAMTS-like protein 1 [Varanus komodoensis]
MVTSWSQCTQGCGGGIQTRRVTCQKLTAAGNSVPMPNDACVQVAKRPVDTQSCNRQLCVEWATSTWGQAPKHPELLDRHVWGALEGQPVDPVYCDLWQLRLPVQAGGVYPRPHQQACAGALLRLETEACQLAALQHHPV